MTTWGTPIDRNASTASAEVCAKDVLREGEAVHLEDGPRVLLPSLPSLAEDPADGALRGHGAAAEGPAVLGEIGGWMREYRTIACAAPTARSGT